MKKLFTLFAIAMMAITASAKVYVLDMSTVKNTVQPGDSVTVNGVVIAVLYEGAQITPQHQIDGDFVDMTGLPFEDSFKFSTVDGETITKIEVTCKENYGIDSAWELKAPGAVWTGSATSVMLNGYLENVSTITVTVEDVTVDVTFGNEGFSYYRYQMNDSTWYLRWQGKEQSSDLHTLALYRTTNLASKFGHFTTADFDLTESYFTGPWVGDGVTEIDVTLTETEYGFTMSGYVVSANGVTYNLAGEYAAPKATPSVTSFTTLSELDGLTINLSGVEVQFAGQDGSIYLTDESLDVLYGEAHNYTFNNNVLTIEGFVYDAEEMDPLPEEGKDLIIYTGGVFAGYRDLILCTIHFGTLSAVENTTATVKAQKVIENGQMVILRDGKKFNAVGAQL